MSSMANFTPTRFEILLNKHVASCRARLFDVQEREKPLVLQAGGRDGVRGLLEKKRKSEEKVT